jgi:hypothetical protein
VEWRDEPRVLDLRKRERLDAVVAGAKGEIEIFKRLTAWSRAQFEPGVPEPYPLCNGVSILDAVRSRKTGGFCGQYSYLLGDALKSFGYFRGPVRGAGECPRGPGTSRRGLVQRPRPLVLLDPLNAALYVRDGTPLSALEIHDEARRGPRRVRARQPPSDSDDRGDRPAYGPGGKDALPRLLTNDAD